MQIWMRNGTWKMFFFLLKKHGNWMTRLTPTDEPKFETWKWWHLCPACSPAFQVLCNSFGCWGGRIKDPNITSNVLLKCFLWTIFLVLLSFIADLNRWQVEKAVGRQWYGSTKQIIFDWGTPMDRTKQRPWAFFCFFSCFWDGKNEGVCVFLWLLLLLLMMMMMMMMGMLGMGKMKGWLILVWRVLALFLFPRFPEGMEGRPPGQPAGKSGLEFTTQDPCYVNVCTQKKSKFSYKMMLSKKSWDRLSIIYIYIYMYWYTLWFCLNQNASAYKHKIKFRTSSCHCSPQHNTITCAILGTVDICI